MASTNVYDSTGRLVERVVVHGAHRITQRRQSDGSWWNIRVEAAR